MDPYDFTDTDEGILNARSALQSLRAILEVDQNDDYTDDSEDASMDEFDVELSQNIQESEDRDEEVTVMSTDKVIALREQLAGLEEMLKIVLDERLARDLSGLDMEVDEESMDVLRRVIRIATDIINSETACSDSDDDEDEEEDFLWDETPRSGRRDAQSDAQIASLEDSPNDPSAESSTSDSVEEPDPTTCLVCGTDLPLTADRVKMPCGHIYCPECTTNLVQTYITQPIPTSQFRCCPPPKPSISPQDLNHHLSTPLLKSLTSKLKEAETPHDQRIYCPQENCKKFIKPERVTAIVKRVGYVKCPNEACSVRICLDCRGLIHIGVDCDTYSDDTQATIIQRLFGWSRCPGCRFVVEKIDGCNEISCVRCGSGFTYITP